MVGISESVKDVSLAGIGALLYTAASPDLVDGFSDVEYQAMLEHGPGLFKLYELLGRSGAIPTNLQLPQGFAKHFETEVIPDLEIVRKDPVKREQFRQEIRQLLSNPGAVNRLYKDGGTTYSQILSNVAKTDRKSKFYEGSEDGGPTDVGNVIDFIAGYQSGKGMGVRDVEKNTLLISKLNTMSGVHWSEGDWIRAAKEYAKRNSKDPAYRRLPLVQKALKIKRYERGE